MRITTDQEGEHGAVLIVALWSLFLFSVMVIVILLDESAKTRSTGVLAARMQARNLADGAVYLAARELIAGPSESLAKASWPERIRLDGVEVTIAIKPEEAKLNLMRADEGAIRSIVDRELAGALTQGTATEDLIAWRNAKLESLRSPAGMDHSRYFLDFDELRALQQLGPDRLALLESEITLYTRNELPVPLLDLQTQAVGSSGLYAIKAEVELSNGQFYRRRAIVQIDRREGGRFRIIRWN